MKFFNKYITIYIYINIYIEFLCAINKGSYACRGTWHIFRRVHIFVFFLFRMINLSNKTNWSKMAIQRRKNVPRNRLGRLRRLVLTLSRSQQHHSNIVNYTTYRQRFHRLRQQCELSDPRFELSRHWSWAGYRRHRRGGGEQQTSTTITQRTARRAERLRWVQKSGENAPSLKKKKKQQRRRRD